MKILKEAYFILLLINIEMWNSKSFNASKYLSKYKKKPMKTTRVYVNLKSG